MTEPLQNASPLDTVGSGSAEHYGSNESSSAMAPVVPSRANKRLRHGIRKPKVYTDGTVKYGLFTTSGESWTL
jgi:hypothetical protein